MTLLLRGALLNICLLFIAPVQAANDGPLILRSTGNSELMTIINPSLGTIQLYRIDGGTLRQESSYNFLADLSLISNQPNQERWDWKLMRTGSGTTSPSYGVVFDKLLSSADKRRRERDELSLAQRAMNSENEFWQTIPDYNGQVRGALGDNILLLVVPSTYTLLWYRLDNWEFKLNGWRNYRADLFIPSVFNSSPSPAELFKSLPENSQANWQEGALERAEAEADSITIAPSDPWVGVTSQGSSEIFVLVDEPNRFLLSYRTVSKGSATHLSLNSARNMEIDLLVPTVYNSLPDNSGVIRKYNQQLKRIGEPLVSADYIEKLIASRSKTGGGGNTINAEIDSRDRLFVDLPFMRKLLTYELSGRGNRLELMAARDYTIEVGLALHQQEIQLRRRGKELAESCADRASHRNTDEIISLLQTALTWNPFMGEELADNRKLRRAFKDDPRLADALEVAGRAAEALRAEQQAILEALAAEEAARQAR